MLLDASGSREDHSGTLEIYGAVFQVSRSCRSAVEKPQSDFFHPPFQWCGHFSTMNGRYLNPVNPISFSESIGISQDLLNGSLGCSSEDVGDGNKVAVPSVLPTDSIVRTERHFEKSVQ